MQELEQMKMLRESMVRIEEGKREPWITAWGQIDSTDYATGGASGSNLSESIMTLGGKELNDLSVNDVQEFYDNNLDAWVKMKQQEGWRGPAFFDARRQLDRGIARVKNGAKNIEFNIFNEFDFTDQALAAGPKKKKRGKRVNKNYRRGNEIVIDVDGWLKAMRDEGYDEDDIEYYKQACDNGEGTILDGEDEGEGMYVDVNGDEFIVPYEFLSRG